MAELGDNKLWDENSQKAFFNVLKDTQPELQGDVVLKKVEELIHLANSRNHYLLKGAESLMNMYTLKYINPSSRPKAKELLATIYAQLGETEKANRFL